MVVSVGAASASARRRIASGKVLVHSAASRVSNASKVDRFSPGGNFVFSPRESFISNLYFFSHLAADSPYPKNCRYRVKAGRDIVGIIGGFIDSEVKREV